MTTEDEQVRERELSCTFCGPGTWSVWDVVTEDGVFFVCDRHHVEMSEAKIIRLERRMGKESWKKINEEKKTLYEEEYSDFEDTNDHE
jgi:hypothetical protein